MGKGKLNRSDSSSSSSSSVRSDGSSSGFSKLKKKDKNRGFEPTAPTIPSIPVPFAAPPPAYQADQHHMHVGEEHEAIKERFPFFPIHPAGTSHTSPPPGSPQSAVPPQGRRFQTSTTAAFPSVDVVGPAPFADYGGEPVYVGSAVFADSVHPAKLVPSLDPVCRVPYGGGEHEHHGRYDLLPITPDMEWVIASHGQIPQGRRPVDGGYEASRERLYHAVGVISGVSVPGKTAPHLNGANIAFGGEEHVLSEGYWILCWRNEPPH